ncbi:MAG: hypothetical protein H6659_07800 [Ardenticatenaceae bacterium]|nr:hypothetical protein [Ardenticatenaceae bacterium]MCB8987434.1 hypothetical protein [Ardenticatenaceae bacterium]
MNKRLLMVLVLVLLLTAVPASVALAAPPMDGDQTVETGESVNNDVILLDGDLEVQDGGTINGDVVLFSGDADISGTINGDLVLFDGDLDAAETAVVNGDCVVLNGAINDNSADGLGCTNVAGLPDFLPLAGLAGLANDIAPQFDDVSSPPVHTPSGPGFFGGLAGVTARSLLFSILAFAVVSLAPTHLAQVETTIKRKPVASGTVGFLTAVAVPTLSVLLALLSAVLLLICIGIVGFAIVFALLAGLGVAALFGWIAAGDLLGQWLVHRTNRQKMSPAMVAALGTFVLTFGLGLFGLVPFLLGEGLVSMIITFIGLGAVALTKFGTQPYPLVRIVNENEDKVTAVLDTLPDSE